MKRIHQNCIDTACRYAMPDYYMAGADLADFGKVVDAMLGQGVA